MLIMMNIDVLLPLYFFLFHYVTRIINSFFLFLVVPLFFIDVFSFFLSVDRKI